MDKHFFDKLDKDGFVISDKVFDENDLRSLNETASNLLPFVGFVVVLLHLEQTKSDSGS